jgi:hypothetical protein
MLRTLLLLYEKMAITSHPTLLTYSHHQREGLGRAVIWKVANTYKNQLN